MTEVESQDDGFRQLLGILYSLCDPLLGDGKENEQRENWFTGTMGESWKWTNRKWFGRF